MGLAFKFDGTPVCHGIEGNQCEHKPSKRLQVMIGIYQDGTYQCGPGCVDDCGGGPCHGVPPNPPAHYLKQATAAEL